MQTISTQIERTTGVVTRGVWCVLVSLLVLGVGRVASADSIAPPADGGRCELGAAVGGGPCSLEEITPFPHGAQNNPLGRGAAWVSFNESFSSSPFSRSFRDFSADTTAAATGMSVFETFSIGLLGGTLSLSVWSDGPASVWLDGVTLVALDRTLTGAGQRGGRGRGQLAARARSQHCGWGSYGCVGSQRQDFSEELASGLHELRIDVEPGGRVRSTTRVRSSARPDVLYSGTASDNLAVVPVPEPSAVLLFLCGSAIVGQGIRRRRKAQAAAAL